METFPPRTTPAPDAPAPGKVAYARLDGRTQVRWDASRDWHVEKDKISFADRIAQLPEYGRGGTFAPETFTHGTDVAVVRFRDGRVTDTGGAAEHPDHPYLAVARGCDGLLVENPGEGPWDEITVAGSSADCAMLAFTCKDRVFGLVHAGWKGVAGDIVGAAASELRDILGDDGAQGVRVVASPMAITGYEFGRETYLENFAGLFERYGIDPKDAAEWAPGDRRGTEQPQGGAKVILRLWPIIAHVLACHGITDVVPPAHDTLDPESCFPSHRRWTKNKQGPDKRFMTSVTWRRDGFAEGGR